MGSKERKQAKERAAKLSIEIRRDMLREDIEAKYAAKLASLELEYQQRMQQANAEEAQLHDLWHAQEVKATKEARAKLLGCIKVAA